MPQSLVAEVRTRLSYMCVCACASLCVCVCVVAAQWLTASTEY